jgi:ATP-binding protein involved in chromosome partitioning
MFARKHSTPPGNAGSGEASRDDEEKRQLRENLEKIGHKIIVLSGKGGVGKSTIAVNLAVSLAERGFSVGLLDVDIHGPSVPKLLGLQDKKLALDVSGAILPVEYRDRLKVISIGFMLQSANDAVIWRGPLKYSLIRQFLKDVYWGAIDYLVIDSPPGTGDEPLSVCQLIENPDGAVIVSTPQDVAILDVRKSIRFCKSLNMPVIGVIENMSGFTCPHCGKEVMIFSGDGGVLQMSLEMEVPFLGKIPLLPEVSRTGDSGVPFAEASGEPSSGARSHFDAIVAKIIESVTVKK